jgi:hypothetical protein
MSGQKTIETEEVLERNIAEFAPGLNDSTFMADLLKNILAKQPELDHIIEKAAPAWSIDVFPRSIAMASYRTFELLFGDRRSTPQGGDQRGDRACKNIRWRQ